MIAGLKNYEKLTKKDLIHKCNYKNITCIPKLECIVLHFGFKSQNLNLASKATLVLELLTGQRCRLTKAKKQNLFLNIKKKSISGSFLRLKKKKMLLFYDYLITDVLSKNLKTRVNYLGNDQKTLHITIPSAALTNFDEIEFNSNYFKDLPDLNIIFLFNKKVTPVEQLLLISQP